MSTRDSEDDDRRPEDEGIMNEGSVPALKDRDIPASADGDGPAGDMSAFTTTTKNNAITNHDGTDEGVVDPAEGNSILQMIANLASPLTDILNGYTKMDDGEIPERTHHHPPKDNVMQRLESRLANKNRADDAHTRQRLVETPATTSWKEKIIHKASDLASPFIDRLTLPVITLDELDVNNLFEKPSIAAVTLLVLLLVVLLWRRRRKGRIGGRRAASKRDEQNNTARRARTGSHDSVGATATTQNRPRSTSFDALMRGSIMVQRDRVGTADDPLADAVGAAVDREQDTPLIFGGVGVSSISYETWTPPMQWSEASRMLLPVNAKPEQEKTVTIDFQQGTLTVCLRGGQQPEKFDIQDVSLHVKQPTTSGVVEIYVKGAPKQEWMEHTFKSAHQAAQFQQDVINYQVVGESVTNMYESLELVQKGSLAHDGKECVLHDDTSDSKKSAVAWDDAMRCFSSIDSLRKVLDHDLLRRTASSDDGTNDAEEVALVEDYVSKRLLLGHFDFFRLFVPLVDVTALPVADSSPTRVNEMLERRKLVARAATFVQAYVQARTVVNKGWNLPMDLPPDSFTKRLAYDDDIDNVQRDSTAKNEYYEATVSRDIRCDVHAARHLQKPGSSVRSQYQAFSLVGSHIFKLAREGVPRTLSHRKDPVLILPTLRELVEAHPELNFFVCAFFPDGLGIAIVHVFVRSLPRGVDASFDTIFDRFMNGTVEVRRRKLEVFMQLGPGARLSPLAWAALKAVSLLLSWSRKGEAQIPFESGADRTPFPGMTMSNYMETAHFGGSLQTIRTLPKNYAAVTAHVDVTKMNPAMRVLYERLEGGALPVSVVDFTFVLEGEQADELPERALGTIRAVHLDAETVALPTSYSASKGTADDEAPIQEEPATSSVLPLSPFIREVGREMSVAWHSFIGSSRNLENEQATPPAADPQSNVPRTNSNDPYQVGIDALRDILRDVTVPIRRESLEMVDSGVADSEGAQAQPPNGDVIKVPVLSRTSTDDLRRYFRATGCDLKEAAVRIVESTAWRGVTFPIDTRKCRVELQSGQFFRQGRDVDGDPVFYFQNMLMGPWRGNVDSSMAALLHRLESSLNEIAKENADVKCTVIALVGKPFKRIAKTKKKKKVGGTSEGENIDEASAGEDNDTPEDGEESTAASVAAHTIDQSAWNPFRMGVNPRVYPEEDYHVHSNMSMFERLSQVLSAHYPERLKRLILVPGQGRSISYMNSTFTMRKFITSSRTRAKVVHLNRASELPNYVEDNELATVVGGWVEVEQDAFEC